jgi:phosphoribosylformimino-5-aminoimidazole carboxamide ribotide isomerase
VDEDPHVKVIPVIDIRQGVAVHARRGERADYRPIRSLLIPGADPVALLRAYRTSLGSRSVYVADLDAISGDGDNLEVVAAMSEREPGLELLVDAGVRSVSGARALLRSGAGKVVFASESLARLDDASRPFEKLGPGRAVFSIDLRNRRVVWRRGSSESTDPCEVAARLPSVGFLDAIILELERIGTGGGPDATFVRRLRRAAPGVRLIVGGGIRTLDDILHLKRAGAAGVLLATALHDGMINRADLARVGAAR